MSLTHLETIELGSSQSSITFSSIPQDYDDLKILISARSDRSDIRDDIIWEVNGSAASFDLVRLIGKDSGTVQSNSASATDNSQVNSTAANTTSNTFGNGAYYISNYTSSSDKSISADYVSENNSSTDYFLGINALLLASASGITSIGMSPSAGTNFVSGSTFSLYGVTAGGDGTVTTA